MLYPANGPCHPGRELRHLLCEEQIMAYRKGKTYEEIYGIEKAKIIKEKLCLARKGHTPMLGKHHTKETKKKISESLKGNTYGTGHTPWNKGKHWSEEVKRKISKAHKGKKGTPHTEETKRKISLATTGHIPWSKGLTKETDERLAHISLLGHTWIKGLTKETDERVKKMAKKQSETMKTQYKRGKRVVWSEGLTKETDERIKLSSERASNTILEQYKNGRKVSEKNYKFYKSGFREDLGHYVRSSWEANFARILKFNKISYKYEKKRFDLGYAIYVPDFYLPKSNEYYEIKGYLRKGSKEKLEFFHKLYPDIKLTLINKKSYKKLEQKYQNIIPKWEV